jgi:hypothetical protein
VYELHELRDAAVVRLFIADGGQVQIPAKMNDKEHGWGNSRNCGVPAGADGLNELHKLRNGGEAASDQAYFGRSEKYGDDVELVGCPRRNFFTASGGSCRRRREMSGCDLHFAHGVDVRIGIDDCSWTIWAPNYAALELGIRCVASVLPRKNVSNGFEDAQDGPARERVDAAVRVCAAEAANFIEGFLVPVEANEDYWTYNCASSAPVAKFVRVDQIERVTRVVWAHVNCALVEPEALVDCTVVLNQSCHEGKGGAAAGGI